MRGFLPSIQSSPVAALSALAPKLTAVLAKADAAVTLVQSAVQALNEFDTIGGKKVLVDAYNALRKKAYGELSSLPHEHPEAMLPASFADRFFQHEIDKGITALRSPKAVQQKIDGYAKKLAAAQAHLDKLNNAAANKAAARKRAQDAAEALAVAKEGEKAARENVKRAEKELEEAKKKT